MSFRRRLTVTVLLILVVPIGAIAILLLRLSSESRTGKADARLAGALTPVLNVYRADLGLSRNLARELGRHRNLATAVAGGPGPALEADLSRIVRKRGLARLEVRSRDGTPIAAAAVGDPVADAAVDVRRGGSPYTLIVSTTTASQFAAKAGDVSGLPVVVAVNGELVASPGVDSSGLALAGDVPRSQDISLPSDEFRVRVVALPDAVAAVRTGLLGPRGATVLSSGQALIGVLLAICVLAALALIVPLLRDLQRLHERTAEEAVTDELTGLSNHRRFQQVIRKEVERAKRFDRPLSVVMVDLDDFKQVNDTYGHLQGDHVLRQVAKMLTSESREVDEPARYGGEEFALVLPETSAEGALEVAERIRSRLESTSIALTDRDVEITMKGSVGVAGTPDIPLDVNTLVKAADDALYRAKRAGKNRIVRAQRSMEGNRLRT
jgi:diguanylate cyclase (GGDEF)-like protein